MTAATIFFAASVKSSAVVSFTPLSRKIFFPSSTSVPSSRTTSGTLKPTALLAATIAQRQLNNGLPATSPPPLNLGGLSVNQRILEPTFRDGLSALSYKTPRGTSLVPSVDLNADDEPMPIPSTWREPAQTDDRWLRQQMGATLLGLCAGLLVVVPIVLWLSGWLGEAAQKSRPPRSACKRTTSR